MTNMRKDDSAWLCDRHQSGCSSQIRRFSHLAACVALSLLTLLVFQGDLGRTTLSRKLEVMQKGVKRKMGGRQYGPRHICMSNQRHE